LNKQYSEIGKNMQKKTSQIDERLNLTYKDVALDSTAAMKNLNKNYVPGSQTPMTAYREARWACY
jgi:hypothetical protein